MQTIIDYVLLARLQEAGADMAQVIRDLPEPQAEAFELLVEVWEDAYLALERALMAEA